MNILDILFITYFLTFVFTLLRKTTFSMVFSLIIVFIIACLIFFQFNFIFLAFMILIIYIGAIAVLFLFMVMLFDRTEYKKIIKFEQSSNLIIFLLALFAFVIGGFLFVNILVIDLFNFDFSTLEFTKKKLGFDAVPVLKKYAFRVFPENGLLISEAGLGKFFSHSKIAQMDCPDVYLIGKFLYTKYFILLIIAGFGLLVAMMGCILITKSSFMDKFNRKNQKIEKQLSRFKI